MTYDGHSRSEAVQVLRHLNETELLKQLPTGFLSYIWGNPWRDDQAQEKIRLFPQVLANPILQISSATATVADSLYCNMLPAEAPRFAAALADVRDQTAGELDISKVWNSFAVSLLTDEAFGAKATFGQNHIHLAIAMLNRGGPRHAKLGWLPIGWRQQVRRRASYQLAVRSDDRKERWRVEDTFSPGSEPCKNELPRLASLRKRDFQLIDALADMHANQANYMCYRFSAPVMWQTVPGREDWDLPMLNTRDVLGYMADRHALAAVFWSLYASAMLNKRSSRSVKENRILAAAEANALHELAFSNAVRKCSKAVENDKDPSKDFSVLATQVFQGEYRTVYQIMADRFLHALCPRLIPTSTHET